MRQFISKYGAYLAGALIVIAAIIMFATRGSSPTAVPTRAFYIDDITGEESIQDSQLIPPLMGKEGKPTVVQVVKISCNKGKDPKVAYYRKFTLQAKQAIERWQSDPNRGEELERIRAEGELVRLPAPGSPWVRAISEEGDRVLQSIPCAPGQTRQAVYP